MTSLPDGFRSYTANVGVKDDDDDFVVITSDQPVATSGVFTRSRFAGPSVTISQRHLGDLTARALVIISKNANVANGTVGHQDAEEVCTLVAQRLDVDTADVVLASTGVIGRRYPMANLRAGIAALPSTLSERAVDRAANAIMTTDTVPKIASAEVAGSSARVVGFAKGVGMIEPNMATMIAVITTDAEVDRDELDATFRSVVDRTFNCVSVDSDTSTSDTAIIMASGCAGPVDSDAFKAALSSVCVALTKMIAADGEGATTLIEVVVDTASSAAQAKRVAKSIVNSPLVKTAVHGADPNWGRVAMAIGKCEEDLDIDPERVVIRFGDTEVYPCSVDEAGLDRLSQYLRRDEVRIHVSLATGTDAATVWGCDLSDGYVRINADYTT